MTALANSVIGREYLFEYSEGTYFQVLEQTIMPL